MFEAALAVAVFAGALHMPVGFYDERVAIVNNSDVVHGGPLLTHDFWGQPLDAHSHQSWRPLTVASFRLNHWLAGGLAPVPMRLTSVLLHACVCVALRRAAGGSGRAVAAAALFAVHPAHTDPVNMLVGRADILCALFALLACAPDRRDGVAACCCVAALLCKEIGVVSPLLVMAARGRWSGRWALGAVGLLALRLTVVGGGRPPEFDAHQNPAAHHPDARVRAATFALYFAEHLGLALWPRRLCHDWSAAAVPLVESVWDRRLLWAAGVVLLVLALVVSSKKATFAGALLLLPLLPASNAIVTVGFAVAERVTYLPSAGACLAVALAAPRRVWRPLMTLLVAAAAVRTLSRNAQWATPERLLRADARSCPGSAETHYSLGLLEREAGDAAAAERRFARAAALAPDLAEASLMLGVARFEAGDLEGAAEWTVRALEAKPDFPLARTNAVGVLVAAERMAEAEAALRGWLAAPACDVYGCDADGALDRLRGEHLSLLAVVLLRTHRAAAALAAAEAAVALCGACRETAALNAEVARSRLSGVFVEGLLIVVPPPATGVFGEMVPVEVWVDASQLEQLEGVEMCLKDTCQPLKLWSHDLHSLPPAWHVRVPLREPAAVELRVDGRAVATATVPAVPAEVQLLEPPVGGVVPGGPGAVPLRIRASERVCVLVDEREPQCITPAPDGWIAASIWVEALGEHSVWVSVGGGAAVAGGPFWVAGD